MCGDDAIWEYWHHTWCHKGNWHNQNRGMCTFAGTLRKWMFPCSDAINRNGWFTIELLFVTYISQWLGITSPFSVSALQTDEAYLPAASDWASCAGSEPHFRGYPCSVWITLHAITVNAYQMSQRSKHLSWNKMVSFLKNDAISLAVAQTKM